MFSDPTVHVIPFHWSHVAQMNLRERERNYFAEHPNYLELARAQAARGPAFSAVKAGRGIGASWGFMPLWQGVIECWLLTGTLVDEFPLTTIRVGRRSIQQNAIAMKAHRLQMTVRCDFPIAQRYAEALGFKPEGVLNSYGPDGSDYVMFARTGDYVDDIRRRKVDCTESS